MTSRATDYDVITASHIASNWSQYILFQYEHHKIYLISVLFSVSEKETKFSITPRLYEGHPISNANSSAFSTQFGLSFAFVSWQTIYCLESDHIVVNYLFLTHCLRTRDYKVNQRYRTNLEQIKLHMH